MKSWTDGTKPGSTAASSCDTQHRWEEILHRINIYCELLSAVLPAFHFSCDSTHTSKTRASKCEQYLASLIHNPNIQHRNFKLLKLIASHALMTRVLMSTHFCWWSTSSRLVTKTLHLKLNDAFQKRWKEVKSIHETIRDERIYLDQVIFSSLYLSVVIKSMQEQNV